MELRPPVKPVHTGDRKCVPPEVSFTSCSVLSHSALPPLWSFPSSEKACCTVGVLPSDAAWRSRRSLSWCVKTVLIVGLFFYFIFLLFLPDGVQVPLWGGDGESDWETVCSCCAEVLHQTPSNRFFKTFFIYIISSDIKMLFIYFISASSRRVKICRGFVVGPPEKRSGSFTETWSGAETQRVSWVLFFLVGVFG